jgi:tRNA dimethylallyltransferase
MDRKTPLIVITGPTGSGKTSLCLDLARIYPLEVISADSMQIYRYMDIATAKPVKHERSLLPHHIIDVVTPDEEFNAGMFTDMAREKITDVLARGNLPIVAGGTGLYIKALIYGLVPAPPRSQKLRSVLLSLSSRNGNSYLWRFLARLDPLSAEKIDPNDSARTIRYLEIIFLTGTPPSNLHGKHRFKKPFYDARIACIIPQRQKLYDDINNRVYQMIDLGLVNETQSLVERGYNSSLRSMQTLAYKHILKYLNSDIDLEKAVLSIQRDTRNYAKRQITWIRSHHDPNSYFEKENASRIISRWIEDALQTLCT